MLRTSVISLFFLCTPLVAHAQQGKVTPKKQPVEQVKKGKTTRLKHTGLKRGTNDDKAFEKRATKELIRQLDEMKKKGLTGKKLPDVRRRGVDNKPADGVVDAEMRKLLGELEKSLPNGEGSSSEHSSSKGSSSQRASDKDSASSKSSSSSSRRIVVVDGKTIVDEKTSSGKPVNPRAKKPGRFDPGKLLKGKDAQAKAKNAADSSATGHASSSGTTRRLVIIDGKKVVDEKTTNDKPANPKDAKSQSKELEDMIRDLDKKDPALRDADLGEHLKRLRDAGKAGNTKKPGKGSPARPVVPVNGKKKG